jgi:septal ring factor EnvC (AmiA/AmiB activator)
MHLLPLTLLLFALLPGALHAAQKSPEADLAQVRERIGALQKSMREDLARRDRLAVQLREAEARVGEAAKRLAAVRRELRASDRRLEALAAERQRNEQLLVAERDALAAQLRAAYVNGREEQLKLLLNQQDAAAMGRVLVYYGYFGRARADRIGRIQAAVQRLEQLSVEEREARAVLSRLVSDQQREVRSFDSARDQRQAALSKLNGQIRTRKDSLAKLRREAAGLQRLVEDLRRRLPDIPPPESGLPFERVRGRLPWPVAGRIIENFGSPRGGGLRWNGLLIAADRGAEVKAPYGGRVVYADWLPGLGLLLIVDHGGSYLSLYGHNEQIYKAAGTSVAAGEVIASVGDSGGRDTPALYFEIRRGSRPIDPRPWFGRGGP